MPVAMECVDDPRVAADYFIGSSATKNHAIVADLLDAVIEERIAGLVS